jgi:cell wall integrity and stress response component
VLDATAQKKTSSGVSGGAIAGIVIGVVAGFAAIILLLIFLWRRNSGRGSNHDNYTGGTKSPTAFSDPFGVMVEDKASFGLSPPHNHANNLPTRINSNSNSSGDNNFMAVDQRLNPVMLGDRRLSEGSIADERDYSRKILRVANPDA